MIQKSKKIKILFAIGRLSVGGAEKLLVHQLRFINRNIFHPKLITMFDEQKESLEDQTSIDECFHFRSIVDISAYIRLYSFLRREQFDVIVTSLFSANLLVRLAAIFARTPAIISCEHNLYPNKSYWQILMDRFLAHWTETIVVDAASVKTFTAQQESIPEGKFFVLYHPPLIFGGPTTSKEALFQKFNISSDAKIILTVSRLVEEKGHSYLIDAAKEIVKQNRSSYFLIVGWGPLENMLRTRIKSLNLENNVILTGRMDIKDILPYADIYVEPAVNVDISIALLEAMQFKKPIVSTNVGEIPLFIKDGLNGFLIEPKNASALADRIRKLLDNKKLRTVFGEESARIIQPYSIESYMQKFEKLLKNIKNYE